ncbi:hypothetical protein V6Z12_A13G123300 [Gossypium hirsutum]
MPSPLSILEFIKVHLAIETDYAIPFWLLLTLFINKTVWGSFGF